MELGPTVEPRKSSEFGTSWPNKGATSGTGNASGRSCVILKALCPHQGVTMATFRVSRLLSFLFVLLLASSLSQSAFADSSHARVIRLSLVQGDVRIAHDLKGDPLNVASGWESATLNLPIRHGDVLATDNGRAEVEFENGAMAFLAENTVLEFYDLSLEDGSFTTRLILRQGSAEFYANPGRDNYFSVTGGDFSVQVEGRATFRLNNYDDGSDVQIISGKASVLQKDKTIALQKGQSFSEKAGDPTSGSVERLADSDEFDQWVSGRIETVSTATNAGLRYNNVDNYSSGFGDLYTYGSWFPVAGYGYCWRPYGVGFGWSPFDYGNWFYDGGFGGWTFIGNMPWGWVPYHYGGWFFQPGTGWVWTPGGGAGRPLRWQPVTATWVRSNGSTGLVPTHPLDVRGKTPLNLREGVFPVSQSGVGSRVSVTTGDNWKNWKRPSREVLTTARVAAAAPERVSRSIADGPNSRIANSGSSISYDRSERRFVNSNNSSSPAREASAAVGSQEATGKGMPPRAVIVDGRNSGSAPGRNQANPPSGSRNTASSGAPAPPRASAPPRAPSTPPPAPRVSGGSGNSGGGSRWGGSSSGSSSGGSSRPSSPAPSSGGGSRPSSGSSGGGRPR